MKLLLLRELVEAAAPKFKVGDKVLLPANKKEGWPEQKGKVIEFSGKYLNVKLDDEYLEDEDDDGIREVTVKDVVLLSK